MRVSLYQKERLWLCRLRVEISEGHSRISTFRSSAPDHELVRCMHEVGSVVNTRACRAFFVELWR